MRIRGSNDNIGPRWRRRASRRRSASPEGRRWSSECISTTLVLCMNTTYVLWSVCGDFDLAHYIPWIDRKAHHDGAELITRRGPTDLYHLLYKACKPHVNTWWDEHTCWFGFRGGAILAMTRDYWASIASWRSNIHNHIQLQEWPSTLCE